VNVLTAALLLRLVAGLPILSLLPDQHAPHRADAVRPGRLLRESWPLFINQLLAGLFFKVDSLLLPGLAGIRSAGVYAAAYKVVDGVGVISSSFTFALFPRLARRAESSAHALAYAYRLSVRLLLQAAFPMATGICLLADPIMGIVAGSDFLPSAAIALGVLIWFLPFSYANGLTQYALIAAGRQKLLTAAFVVALVFNLGANLLLIPRYGFVGAAVVTVFSELVLMVPFGWAARSALPGVSVVREGASAAGAAALMAPVVWWTRDALGLAPSVAIGAGVYLAALWALGGIHPDQWMLVRAATARRPEAAP
jgi:O-antigen/teichoic acid export membrane protein